MISSSVSENVSRRTGFSPIARYTKCFVDFCKKSKTMVASVWSTDESWVSAGIHGLHGRVVILHGEMIVHEEIRRCRVAHLGDPLGA